MKIGCRIKNLRNRQGITLNTLREKTGLTTSFLSQLERDLTSPSLSSLAKIAHALNANVTDFFQNPNTENLVFVKKDARRKIFDKKRKILIETLASGFFDINMQSQLFTLDIGAELTKAHIPASGDNFVMVLKGITKFLYNTEEFLFRRGDSIYYASAQGLNKIVNIGKIKAKLFYISFKRT